VIGGWKNLCQGGWGGASRRLDTRVNARFTAFVEELSHEARLKNRFASGDRHPAAGRPIEHLVRAYRIKDLIDAHLLAMDHKCLVGAHTGTLAAANAAHARYTRRSFRVEVKSLVLAYAHAGAAAGAEGLDESHFGPRRDALGISTPPAGESASFQEYRRSYAGSIMNGVALNISYQGIHNDFGVCQFAVIDTAVLRKSFIYKV